MKGVRLLVEHGFLPIITMARTWDLSEDERILAEFRSVLKEQGCGRPRLKVLPRLQIGAEANRTEGYVPHDRISLEMMDGLDASQLICQHSRVITARGISV